MSSPAIMFISHTGKISGAEKGLLDLLGPWPNASAFLFEDGPLRQALAEKPLTVKVSRWGSRLGRIRRDSSILTVLPLIGWLGAITVEVGLALRNHKLAYANSQKAFVLAALATLVVRRPLIWHLHDIIDAAHFGRMQRRIQVLLANLRATKVIVPSDAAAAAFAAAGGRPHLVVVVPNGLAIDDPQQWVPAELRRDLDLPEGPLVGVFSRLAHWKGQHVMLRALATLPGVNCIFAGGDLFGEQAYAARLAAIVDELDLAGRVRFLGHRSDVPKLMRAVDIMVHPSIDPEPFGRTLVEAMLTGIPVIATDTGAASSILEGGKAGTLVPPGDAERLAAAIRHVMSAPAGLATQLAYAGTRARLHYSLARMQDSIWRLIRDVLNGERA